MLFKIRNFQLTDVPIFLITSCKFLYLEYKKKKRFFQFLWNAIHVKIWIIFCIVTRRNVSLLNIVKTFFYDRRTFIEIPPREFLSIFNKE